jgi:hypothetical protein
VKARTLATALSSFLLSLFSFSAQWPKLEDVTGQLHVASRLALEL